MKCPLGLWCVLLFLAPLRAVAAQNVPESSLTLQVQATGLQGEWAVRLLDLNAPLDLDVNHDGQVSWPEIEHRRQDIQTYLASHLKISADGAQVSLVFDKLIYGAQGGEPFILARLSSEVAAETVNTIGVTYTLPDSCVLKVVWTGEGMQQSRISARNGGGGGGETLRFARADAASSGFLQSLQQGVWHIWTGYDHILFLIVLLIPAVLRSSADGPQAVSTFTEALLSVVIIVSAFTVAHSITLACAATGWIRLPSRLVESVIAASIVIAALSNLLPRTAGGRSAGLASTFGLIHGFGFAGALSEIGAQGAPLWRTLVAFNLGVEAGQLAIVALFLPFAYLLRQTRFYRTGVLYGGSSIAGLCALFWLWERAIRGAT